jgi:hypothetical protein
MSEMLICETCGREFPKHRKTARFCSGTCNRTMWYKEYVERGKVNKHPIIKTPKVKVKKEIEISNCLVCNAEFRKTRRDKLTCGRACANRITYLRKTNRLKENYVNFDKPIVNNISKEIEPYLLDWKRRRFMLNETDLFRAIDLWDRIFPNKFLSDGIEREELFEGIITDLILYYKKNKKACKDILL